MGILPVTAAYQVDVCLGLGLGMKGLSLRVKGMV